MNEQLKNSIEYAVFEIWKDGYDSGEINYPKFGDTLDEVAPEVAHKRVLNFFRMIFEYLGIEPGKLQNVVGMEFLKKYCLNSIFEKYLIFPTECKKNPSKLDYFPKLLYPDLYSEYERSVQSIWDTEYEKTRVAKDCGLKYKIELTDDPEYNRVKLSYLFNNYMRQNPINDTGNDIRASYSFFGSPKGRKYVAEALLLKECDQVFDSPLELFHESLPASQRSNFLYGFELFKNTTKSKK